MLLEPATFPTHSRCFGRSPQGSRTRKNRRDGFWAGTTICCQLPSPVLDHAALPPPRTFEMHVLGTARSCFPSTDQTPPEVQPTGRPSSHSFADRKSVV